MGRVAFESAITTYLSCAIADAVRVALDMFGASTRPSWEADMRVCGASRYVLQLACFTAVMRPISNTCVERGEFVRLPCPFSCCMFSRT